MTANKRKDPPTSTFDGLSRFDSSPHGVRRSRYVFDAELRARLDQQTKEELLSKVLLLEYQIQKKSN
jgi:hypothetical protein